MAITATKSLSVLSLKVKEGLHLISETLNDKVKQKPVVVATDNYMVVDCSGSMYDELPELRKHLKNKVSSLLGDNDTLTLIAFSGNNETTVIFEHVPISTLKDLSKIHQSIDKFLRPTGLTNFIEPLEVLKDVISRGKQNRPEAAVSAFMLSDGYHNTGGSSSTVLSVTKKLASLTNSFTLCAYGNYADENMLNKMAEVVGGQMINSENFEDYEPIIEQALTKRLGSYKKKEITLPHTVKNNLIISVDDRGDVTVYTVDETTNTALVPDDLESITYLTEDVNISNVDDSLVNYIKRVHNHIDTNDKNKKELQNIYGIVSVLAQRMKSLDVYSILESLGDKEVSYAYCNAFGKQNLATFNQMLLLKVKLQDAMFKEGYDLKAIPPVNAFCLMDLIDIFINDKDAKWFPGHESFKYNRIGAKRKQKNIDLTDEETQRIQDLSEELKNTTDVKRINEITTEINSITSVKGELKFETTSKDIGYSFTTLTWNEDRPNLSVLVRYDGKVKLPENNRYNINEVNTFTYRNYAFIKDGVVNIDVLPASFSEATFNRLKSENLIESNETWSPDKIFLINLRKKLNGGMLPVINRSMVKNISAKETFEKAWELIELQAAQKVFGHYEKQLFPKESKGMKELYGEEATKWLSELGITDYNGFSPKTVADKIGESYMAKELKISIKSFSSLPSINALEKKLGSGKSLTPSEELLNKYYEEYQNFLNSEIYKKSANQKHLLETWLKDKKKEATTRTRQLLTELAKVKMSLILSQQWFSEFDDTDNTSMTIDTADGNSVFVTATLKDVEEKI